MLTFLNVPQVYKDFLGLCISVYKNNFPSWQFWLAEWILICFDLLICVQWWGFGDVCPVLSSPLRHPSLLLLVCQSSTQKRPSVYLFSCTTVSAQQASQQTQLWYRWYCCGCQIPPLWWRHRVPVCALQAESIRDDIKQVVSHCKIRENR